MLGRMVDITLRIQLRDYGAFEDLVKGLGNDPEITQVVPVETPASTPRTYRSPTETDIKYIQSQAGLGVSIHQIGTQTGWAQSTIKRVLAGKCAGKRKKPLTVTADLVRKAKAIAKKHPALTKREVAAQVGLAPTTTGSVLSGKYDHLLKQE